jgi:hypothetical protein
MGSSGMKRKGRKHLPKVGTRPQLEHELHDRREVALHPFSENPLRRRSGYGVIALVVGLFAVIGAIALIAFT